MASEAERVSPFASRSDLVVVRVAVCREVLEPRKDAEGDTDYYVIHSEVVSVREWTEARATALPAAGEAV